MKVNCILLAAGRSSRFGANKLLENLDGKPVVTYAIEKLKKMPFHRKVIVVGKSDHMSSRDEEEYRITLEIAASFGFEAVVNDRQNLGISYSIKLGTSFDKEAEAYFFVVGDQPLLSERTLTDMLTFAESGRWGIVCAGDGTHFGNPAVFNSKYIDELLVLSGDQGAKVIIKKYLDDCKIYEVADSIELADVDTPEEFREIKRKKDNNC